MRSIETAQKQQGYTCIVGIDEAGRGCLAGPVVAAAVQIIPVSFLAEIKDSKRLTPKKREIAYEEIWRTCRVGVGIASVSEIDTLNILQATFLAMTRAVEALPEQPDFCLVDGSLKIPALSLPQRAVVQGDNLSLSIAAASIVAKVERDRLMDHYDRVYPFYKFGQNKGYGTKEHRLAIFQHGRCPIHRESFRVTEV